MGAATRSFGSETAGDPEKPSTISLALLSCQSAVAFLPYPFRLAFICLPFSP
ncbi:hypothetical protein predicted by Glimmer/Critica [Acetobacter senegalensis]|uniref:Uncharacterized protein n=1 Tax=Acetobacter senegalensis TaxID=446692 RepID=A0A0U5ERQ0_9PROT|nr:hypothetical protein predicted by Glimmer/Critica [Acetobacter senegalensis]